MRGFGVSTCVGEWRRLIAHFELVSWSAELHPSFFGAVSHGCAPSLHIAVCSDASEGGTLGVLLAAQHTPDVIVCNIKKYGACLLSPWRGCS